MHRVTLKGGGDLGEWRDRARALLQAGVAPERIDWRTAGGEADLLEAPDMFSAAVAAGAAIGLTVPSGFVDLAAAVICHADPARFALLYRLLWRLQAERQLLGIRSDGDVVRARMMEKAVRRDCHKMTAFVRFKEVDPDVIAGAPRRRQFVAWFEPDHHIVARVAPFFQRRFTDMDWMINTPKGSAAWDGERLAVSGDPAARLDIRDSADDLWRIYFANIFNPARLKVKAMQAEMPKKYWKNLPEAELIPGMIADAEARVAEMAARQASQPQPFHDRLQAAARAVAAAPLPVAGTIDALREEASGCTRCPLHCAATQTVFGEGPADAAAMFVGEQPGDHEDLAGRPFVGPAGQVFDRAVSLAGIDRRTLYVTNAVKHFKYEPRGKRRIHQKPNMGEIQHCRWWLEREIDLVRPKLVVALGATALFALTDSREKLSGLRGQVRQLRDGRFLFVTVHPAYLLRIPDQKLQQEELARFDADMAMVRHILTRIDSVVPPIADAATN